MERTLPNNKEGFDWNYQIQLNPSNSVVVNANLVMCHSPPSK